MSRFSQRSYEEELMDDLASSEEVIHQTLRELETINRFLGGNQVTTNSLEKLLNNRQREISIADLGCGGGDMLKLVAKWANRKGLNVKMIGYDANPNIIKFAKENCRAFPNIKFEVQDIFSVEFKAKEFDIILCTLFAHHFHEDALTSVFKQFKKQTKLGVVINDLHRHWFAYHSIKILTKFFSKSEMVQYDGPLSVLRSFSRNDLKQIMKKAQINQYELRWMWAFRWQLIF